MSVIESYLSPARQRILEALPSTVDELAAETGLCKAAVRANLAALETIGAVNRRPYYEVGSGSGRRPWLYRRAS